MKQKHKEIVSAFKNDKVNNANKIVDLLEELKDGESKTLPSAVAALYKIFSMLLKSKHIKKSTLPEDVQSATEKYSNWLSIQYEKYYDQLIFLLSNSKKSVQELALVSMVKLIQLEGKNPVKKTDKKILFPIARLSVLIRFLVSSKNNNVELISHLQQYMEFQDFIFYTIRILSNLVKDQQSKTITETYITNLYAVLEQIDVPADGKFSTYQTLLEDAPPISDSINDGEEDSVISDETNFTFEYKEAQSHLNIIWMEFIKYKLPVNIYKKCLVHIPDKAMPHLKHPIKLTDFFMESYEIGGVFSLLALQGVFILISKHNLDYPSFYKKLYSLLEPTIFHAKYKPRFFMLLNLFLSSTHLPEYVIASFIKRLSRLSLVAPCHSQILLIKFVANLLVRYPSLRHLINNPDAEPVESDPFDANEDDPLKTNASKSSLWEIATLKSHFNPAVSKAAAFVERNPPDIEFDLGPYVETTYEEVFGKSTKIHMKEVPTTFHRPTSVFNYSDDQMSSTWSLY